MGKEKKYQTAAEEILRLVGGKENVISAAHCATRLRLVLKDEKKADVEGILNTELVKGQFATGGQFQIIIGSGIVDEVYKYFIQYADIQESSKNEVKNSGSKNEFSAAFGKDACGCICADYSGACCKRTFNGAE